MKLPKTKKLNRKKVVKDLDQAFSKYIRAKYIQEHGNICPFCHKNPIEHCFHFISRVSHSTRWLEDNVIGSCSGCNFTMEFSPAPFLLWFIDHRGRNKLEYLQGLAHTSAKYTTNDLLLLTQEYQDKLTKLEKYGIGDTVLKV